MPLDSKAILKLQETINNACADIGMDIPGVSVAVVGRHGEDLFLHSAGGQGMKSIIPMTPESIFWLASCTKMLTGLACMQLVENETLRLDDAAQLDELCPELRDTKVLRADGELEEKKSAITLRMLLTHTAGFGYSFFNERLRNWALPVGLDEFSGRLDDMKMPLLFQPGTGWEYGVGIDWAGLALERATGLGLDAYLQKHIFEPLGLKNMSMFPSEEMIKKLAHMHAREKDGTLRLRDHLLRQPLVVDHSNDAEINRIFNSGGAGMFGKPQEYAQVLAVLLNDGTCPRTGVKLLNKKTVDEMFRNQIPEFPDFGRTMIPAVKPDLTNTIPELYPVSGNPPQGWGLTWMLSGGGSTGRSTSTAHWAGLSNCWWWCDREAKVAGIVCTQILPFADAKVLELWANIESQIYASRNTAG